MNARTCPRRCPRGRSMEIVEFNRAVVKGEYLLSRRREPPGQHPRRPKSLSIQPSWWVTWTESSSTNEGIGYLREEHSLGHKTEERAGNGANQHHYQRTDPIG